MGAPPRSRPGRRPAFATRLAEDGASATEIHALLGHESLHTSQGYIDATANQTLPGRPTGDPETFEQLAGAFDLIVNTVSARIDLDAYLSLLAVDGTMVNVGAPAEPMSINVFPLLLGRRSFAGSAIGGIQQTQEMLDFCAEHHLGAEIEVISADKINEAYERVLVSDVRYRFVIDTSTLG